MVVNRIFQMLTIRGNEGMYAIQKVIRDLRIHVTNQTHFCP